MKFLEHQAEAKSNTTRFVLLYVLGVVVLGLLGALAMHLVLNLRGAAWTDLPGTHWSLVATAAICTWGTIVVGSTYRLTQLRQGGRLVAESLGGSLLGPATKSPAERRALNIVEEMALAAGLPVPPVYVLRREQGVNAFAAGWSSDDAVLGLTQGALEKLTRSELQGVVAHEFSHILNRDTALNMRLLGTLHGILMLSLIGEFLMRTRSSGPSKRSAAPFVVLGASVWLFGAVGALLAQILQTRVSREREYLADASAVQFTRDPGGLARALAKIGLESSYLESSFGSAASHMLIAAPHEARFFDFSSHPPLAERIRRLVPGWDGRLESLASPGRLSLAELDLLRPDAYRRVQGGAAASTADGAPGHRVAPWPPGSSLAGLVAHEPAEGTGQGPGPEFASSTTPRDLVASAREPYEARLLLLALMLDDEARARGTQLTLLATLGDDELARIPKLRARLDQIDPRERLPLADVALGSLAALSKRQANAFLSLVEAVRGALRPLSHRAFCVARLVERHLVPPRAPSYSVKPHEDPKLRAAIARLLGVMARRGNASGADAERAFGKGVQLLAPTRRPRALPTLGEVDLKHLDDALATLFDQPLATRSEVVRALAEVASEDGVVFALEAELLNTFRVCLNVPVAF